VVGGFYLNQIFLSLLTTGASAVAYSIQSTATSASVTSIFSLPVSTTILDLIILEFISWRTNLRKQTELHTNLNYNTY
jgi:hypothetical protein